MSNGKEELTQKVKAGLKRLGYIKERAALRSKIYENAAKGCSILHSQVNRFRESLTVVITGSHREGMAGFWESDTDQLIIPQSVDCIDERIMDTLYLEGKNVFILDYKDVPEGYALLKCQKIQENTLYTNIIKNDCICRDGVWYLVNNCMLADIVNVEEHTPDLFKNKNTKSATPDMPVSNEMKIKLVNKERHGPARPFTLRIPLLGYQLDYDNVIAFKCHSLHLEEWCKSKIHKQTQWPDASTIEKIRKLDTYVVPIGVEGTDNETLQWRISHALAEVELVSSFNDTQIKVYGLLKLTVKTVLEKSLRQCINDSEDVPSLSYMVKNVMFWISEEETADGFTEELFVDRFLQALQKLLTAVKTGHLQCYMFPTRNICTRKLIDEIRQKLSEELNVLLLEGISMVKRIPQLKDHIGEDIDSNKLDEQAKRRLIREYFFMAQFTLPAERSAEVKQQFLTIKWSIQAVQIYFKEVWPYFIKNVTDDMFDDFTGRSDIRKFIHIVSEYIGFRNFFRYLKQLCKQ